MKRSKEDGVDLRLLGDVQASVNGHRLDLGPRQQRFMFAVLALDVNRTVPVSRLIELTWGATPPRTAKLAVQVSMSRLRTSRARVAGSGTTVVRQGSGYVLLADPSSVDAHRFRALVAQARAATCDQQRLGLLEQGLRLWRGPALDGTAPVAARERLCAGLEESRLAALEDRFDAKLRLGQHHEVLEEVPALLHGNPFRERLVGQLMLAFYRAGRTDEALSTYRAARARLVAEVGLEPGAELRRLERAILTEDPAMAAPGSSGGSPSWRS